MRSSSPLRCWEDTKVKAMLLFRARWALLGALAVGVGLAVYQLDPYTRSRAMGAVLTWLAVNWAIALPWGLCGVLALLWRRQLRLAARWREAVDYWILQYDEATRPAVAAKRATAGQQQPRPRSKVGAGRRV